MSNVLDFYTGEEYVERKAADLEAVSNVLYQEIFDAEVKDAAQTLELVLSCLEKLQERDWDVLAEAIDHMPLSNITLACLALREKVKMGGKV